jgi:hypothetical protein
MARGRVVRMSWREMDFVGLPGRVFLATWSALGVFG